MVYHFQINILTFFKRLFFFVGSQT